MTVIAASTNGDAWSIFRSKVAAAGVSIDGLSDISAMALAVSNMLSGTIAFATAGAIAHGEFGSATGDTGTYIFPNGLVIVGKTVGNDSITAPSVVLSPVGSFHAGAVIRSTTLGLQIAAVAGSTNDLTITDPSGATNILSIPTGTTRMVILSGQFGATGPYASGGDISLNSTGSIQYNSSTNNSLNLVSVQADECWLGNSVTHAKMVGSKNIIGATGQTLCFFDATGTTKQTVTGSKGANAALASLLTALNSYGIITDSSS